ncbi:hypothetical protein RF11_12789 [Thelohanellus kitauei]|uniref:Ras-associating domain-containing protein n=1 Tax=Thelohanellus kitauei TaxID=669202 RepID=A0A0C2M2R5_THEKT|nr:hypothetical protein RF11_12789 [Thelohanellus kitauei]
MFLNISDTMPTGPCATESQSTPDFYASDTEHQFLVFNRPAYCDHCQSFIWGVSKRTALRCLSLIQLTLECQFTTHKKCLKISRTDCKSANFTLISPKIPTLARPSISFTKPNSKNNDLANINPLKHKLALYNKKSENTIFFMCEDNSFVGPLVLVINIRRSTFKDKKTNHVVHSSPWTESDLSNHNCTIANDEKSFIELKEQQEFVNDLCLPIGKKLSVVITSNTNTQQVVELVMKKLNLESKASQYCLVVREIEGNNSTYNLIVVKISKVPETEYPLNMLLEWGPNDNSHMFSFEENEFDEITVGCSLN